jgi:branched-chain amino acid transport system ATP-binding protein
MTVREHLLMGAYVRKDQKNVPNDMEMVFQHFPILKEKINELAANLSGGQQQMLAMGRALLSRPKLFLLDEPSLGLAPMLVREVLDIIRGLNNSGTTVLLVEQNARAALRVAHRSYVMESGQIVLEDTAKNMLENPMVRKVYLGVT